MAFLLTVTEPGWLIYADAFDPRSSVRIDGADAVDWRANFAYKAVHLDPGSNTVEMAIWQERPPNFSVSGI